MLTTKPESFEEYKVKAQTGNVIPVTTTIAADLQTPFGIYLLLRENAGYSFLLESIEGGSNVARFSFLGANPQKIMRGVNSQTIVEENGKSQTLGTDLLETLRSHFADKNFAGDFDLSPFAGGAVGFFNFSAIGLFEPSLREEHSDDGFWLFFNTTIAFDHAFQSIKITTLTFTDGEPDLQRLYHDALRTNQKIAELLQSTPTLPKIRKNDKPEEFTSSWKKVEFLGAVSEIKEKILAGDCYQVVISQKFRKRTPASPISIYRALRSLNPSPYMFLFEFKGKSIIGASPEMLVRCRGKNVEYRPIAGTRPRGKSEIEDSNLASEMINDEKETAEHLMLVDLGRNDLGRIAEYGSVKVDKLMSVEKYSHVQHLVSNLSARIAPDKDAFDALAACFPAGTVSGAPKVKAVAIIKALEPESRGIYAGAVGYIDYAGNMDTCIAIRTMVLEDGMATIQAGAGIVADSIPEKEFDETVHKAKGLFRAIEVAEG